MTERKMNPVIKAMWVADLRSGNFPQGTGLLHRAHSGQATDHTFCCLGVLSERAVAEGVCERTEHDRSADPSFTGVYVYKGAGDLRGHHHYLPESVQEWAGLDDEDPFVTIDGERARLSNHNDNGVSFGRIADAIEEQL